MIKVESLQYDTFFKKGFRDVDIFTGLVKDFTGIHLEIDEVENDKVFDPPIGRVKARFDLFAQDKKNRIIVEAQHGYSTDDFDRFFYYHAIAMAEIIHSSEDYRFPKLIITLVFFTEKTTPKADKNILVQDLEIRDQDGEIIEKARRLKHQIIFVFTKDPLCDLNAPEPCRQWIEAINDTLDKQVDENDYDNPLIKQLFQAISKDKTTPEEYAQMKEEFNQRTAVKDALLKTARNLKANGKLMNEEIAEMTDLTLAEVQVL